VSTSNFALLRIEARATNDIRFFVDNNMSDGISMTECGQATNSNAIPTFNLGPAINVGHVARGALMSAASNGFPWTANVDLFAFVQDDPIDKGGSDPLSLSDEVVEVAPAASLRPDPIEGADVAEHYYIEGKDLISDGEIMSAGDVAGEATSSAMAYDRKLLGVVSWQPGLQIGAQTESTLPIALNGRVLTRVSDAGGAISVGDPITSSEVRGVGMKATKPGKIIGTALESFTGTGEAKIMVNVNIGYYLGEQGDTALIEQPREITLQKTDGALSDLATGSALLSDGESSASGRATLISKLMDFGQGMTVDKFFISLGKALFKGQVEFLEKVKFNELVEYLKDVIYSGNVTFKGNVQFNRDTAGYVTVPKGKRFIDVSFTNSYQSTPVVNATLMIPTLTPTKHEQYKSTGICSPDSTLDACHETVVAYIFSSNIHVIVTGQTKQGFMVLLDREAPIDLTFSWSAIAVRDGAVDSGEVSGATSDVVVPTSTPTPASNPSGNEGASVSPTPTSVPALPTTTTTPSIEPTPIEVVSPTPAIEPTIEPTTEPTPTP
jgi:hypothetical protein